MKFILYISLLFLSELTGSNQQILSEFVKITKVKSRYNAEWLLKKEGWNLDSAIIWFYKHNDDVELKGYFDTDIEDDAEKQGNSSISDLKAFLEQMI